MPPNPVVTPYYRVMRPGLRPRIVRQIFAPVPAARSRCLSSFIALSRQDLPIGLRYEPSHVLAGVSLLSLIVGFSIEPLTRMGGTLVFLGWWAAGFAVLALVVQDKIIYGTGRPRLLRQLDEVRRTVGLDEALLPETLEFLESTALQWERIEHALGSTPWLNQLELRSRISSAAHRALEDIVVLECGSIDEAGHSDGDAEARIAETASGLRELADAVDAAESATLAYTVRSHDADREPANDLEAGVIALEGAVTRLEILTAPRISPS